MPLAMDRAPLSDEEAPMHTERPTGATCPETGQPVYEVRLTQKNAAGRTVIDEHRVTCQMRGCSIHPD